MIKEILNKANQFIYNNSDKLGHALVMCAICVILKFFLPIFYVLTIGIILSMLKEIYDKKIGKEFNYEDLLADGLGIILGVL